MGKPTEVTSLRYTLGAGAKGSAIGDYRIETSLDGESYTLIKKGSLSLDEDGKASLYFDNGKDPWICTYDARYLRITAVGQAGGQLSVAELDVFGPSGDDVSFLDANGGAAGILKSDFVYQKADENLDKQFIPKGSLVFTGSYKGNPAYNVVVLYDENGNVVGGVNADGSTVASQIIMAPEPGDAMLGDVSEGSWGLLDRARRPCEHEAAQAGARRAVPRGQRVDERGTAPGERLASGQSSRQSARRRARRQRDRRSRLA